LEIAGRDGKKVVVVPRMERGRDGKRVEVGLVLWGGEG